MMLTDNSETDAAKISVEPVSVKDESAQRIHVQPNDTDGEYIDTDSLEVRLSFQIGKLTLSLNELRQIRPGFTFDLQKRLTDHPVSVIANGMLFAAGELVCIGDFIGVRITRLSGSSDIAGVSHRQ